MAASPGAARGAAPGESQTPRGAVARAAGVGRSSEAARRTTHGAAQWAARIRIICICHSRCGAMAAEASACSESQRARTWSTAPRGTRRVRGPGCRSEDLPHISERSRIQAGANVVVRPTNRSRIQSASRRAPGQPPAVARLARRFCMVPARAAASTWFCHSASARSQSCSALPPLQPRSIQ